MSKGFETLLNLLRLYHTPRFDTARADRYSLCLTVFNAPYLLQVRVPASLSFVMCMTDIISNHRLFTANLTDLCHLDISFRHCRPSHALTWAGFITDCSFLRLAFARLIPDRRVLRASYT
jgi:hypothetical protein